MTTLAEYENRVKPVHVRGCPCDDCYDARLARIMAAWVELGDFNQRDLASMFVQRFDGRRGRWMEFKTFPSTPSAGHWEPAQTILDAAGGLIATLCGDSASDAARWGKLAVYKDVLALAREHLTIDQWDAWGRSPGADAIKRRLRIWPFTHKPTEVDPRLGEKLQEPAMLGKVDSLVKSLCRSN